MKNTILIMTLCIIAASCNSTTGNNNTEFPSDTTAQIDTVQNPFTDDYTMLFFYDDRNYSVNMKAVMDTFAGNYLGLIHIETIDVTKDSSLIDTFDINFVPTVIVLNQDGFRKMKQQGYLAYNEWLARLKKMKVLKN